MTFDVDKKRVLEALYNPDKSKKGSVDEPIITLLDIINKHKDFYTTSSCSGRISLFTDNMGEIKADSSWLVVSHNDVAKEEIFAAIADLPDSEVFFRFEGLILHVCCRNFEDAKKFMIFAQNNGFKHTGILAASKRFIVQVLGTERFDVPIARDGYLLVDEDYILELIEMANKRLMRTHEQIERLKIAFEKEF